MLARTRFPQHSRRRRRAIRGVERLFHPGPTDSNQTLPWCQRANGATRRQRPRPPFPHPPRGFGRAIVTPHHQGRTLSPHLRIQASILRTIFYTHARFLAAQDQSAAANRSAFVAADGSNVDPYVAQHRKQARACDIEVCPHALSSPRSPEPTLCVGTPP